MSKEVEFYDYNRIKSYNALFNFILSPRGNGKTYGAKKFVIKRFLKYGEQFIYVRRYKTEFKKLKLFFDDIRNEFPGVKMFGTMKNVNNMAHIKALFGKYNTGHPLHNGL